MGQAIQHGAGEPLAPQDLGSLLERQIGRHDQTGPLVRRGDDVEEELRSGLAGRHVAQLVQDQQVELSQLGAQPKQQVVIPGLHQQASDLFMLARTDGDLIARPTSGWWQAYIPTSSGNQYTFYCARPFLIDTTVAHPQLSVHINDGRDVACADTVLTYSVQVSNIGAGPALQVSVTDTLPQGLDLISCSEPVRVLAAGSRSLLCWELATRRPGETVRLAIRAKTNERAVDEIVHAILVSWSDVLFTDYRPIRCSDRDSLAGQAQRVEMTNSVNPVELSHFSGLARPGAIRLNWLTQSETDNLGFNVWRCEQRDGDYRRINASMISGAGSSQDPHTYGFEDGEVQPGVAYYYKLEDVDYSGHRQSHGPYRVVASGQPAGFALEQNYPNPFNNETVIEYGVEQPGYVSLAIYNLLGQSVKVLAQGNMEAGSHSARWNGRDEMGQPVQSGTYCYVLQTGAQRQVRKMQLIQ